MKKLINIEDHCPPESNTEITDPSKAASHRNPTRSYAALAISGSAHTVSPSKESADGGFTLEAESAVPSPKVSCIQIDSDGFKTITYKKKTATGKCCETSSPTSYSCTIPSFSPIISKKERSKALSLSFFFAL
jgi:hypothetical protein